MATKQIAIRLDEETWKQFKVALAYSGKSAQEILETAVREFVIKQKESTKGE